MRRERDDAEAVGVAIDDGERAPTDRSRRPEYRDPYGHTTPPPTTRITRTRYMYPAGRVKNRASKRSSTPPCPGKSRPESLTPASLLNKDSTRSPVWAATAMSAPPSAPDRRPTGSPSQRNSANSANSPPTTTAPMTPATAPTTVFPGLTAGINLRRPHARPAKKAQVSLIHVRPTA